MKLSNKNKNIAFLIAGLFVLVGSYNAVVINSESGITNNPSQYTKRLDEVYGVKVPAREIAATWKKLENPVKAQPEVVKAVEPKIAVEPTFVINDEPAVKSELSLKLVEVIHPTKWKDGLTQNQFNGSIEARDGVIENLNIALPNNEGVSVSFAELKGNVFEYDLNGEIYTGMMYQVDQSAFMVTLSNGPLEGMRLRFTDQNIQQAQEVSNEEQTFAAGNFGEEAPVNNEFEQVAVSQNQQQVGFNL